MLGIIGAMDVEVNSLKSAMEYCKIKNISGMNFCQGKIDGKDVVVVKSGIGKVNSAICTQILIDSFTVDSIINTGVAGALNPEIEICDIVISTTAQQHDVDVSPLGYAIGQIPDMESCEFHADTRLQSLAEKSIQSAGLPVNVFHGKVISGDQFISNTEKKMWLRQTFHGDCTEMEGAAIAQVCTLNEIPFLIIRAISDQADGKGKVDYPAFEKKAAENSISLLREMIKNY